MLSISFFVCLLSAFFVYWTIPKQAWRNIFLSVASVACISFLDKWAGLVVVCLSLYTYFFALLITRKSQKNVFNVIGIVGLVLILIIFKYLGLLVNTWNSLAEFSKQLPFFSFEKLLLPLGLSYIIFKYISYLTDVSWGVVKKGKFIDFICYGSLFTIYVAGPIERFENLKPQLEQQQNFSFTLVGEGFERIVFGIFKKAVLADWIGYFITPVLSHQSEHSFFIQCIALTGFSLQIYFDFSGYSDIAIGSSRLFGFKIMENFNWPYLQPNIALFWRCWHISLSSWIRDYLFFPLNRCFSAKWWNLLIVPIIAMGLCGLWHGASWNFLLWGMLHGAALVVFQLWITIKKKYKPQFAFTNAKWFNSVSILVTFAFVTFAWIWFR
jgi:alginate O-acetyltransferase complex protein AlgI